MTFLGFIRKVCITLVLLALLVVLVLLFVVLRALPSKRNILPSDKVWTSDVYTKYFCNPTEWKHIETFVYDTFVPNDLIHPEFSDDKNALTAEVFRILWDERNSNGKLYTPSTEGPIVGSTGGTEAIQAEVVHRKDKEVAFIITSRFNGYMGGLETVEVEILETGVMIKLKYIWHNPRLPRPWKFQWFGVYTQLVARTMWLEKAVAGVTKVAAEVEDVNNLHRDL